MSSRLTATEIGMSRYDGTRRVAWPALSPIPAFSFRDRIGIGSASPPQCQRPCLSAREIILHSRTSKLAPNSSAFLKIKKLFSLQSKTIGSVRIYSVQCQYTFCVMFVKHSCLWNRSSFSIVNNTTLILAMS